MRTDCSGGRREKSPLQSLPLNCQSWLQGSPVLSGRGGGGAGQLSSVQEAAEEARSHKGSLWMCENSIALCHAEGQGGSDDLLGSIADISWRPPWPESG